jgi:hypothetical protein
MTIFSIGISGARLEGKVEVQIVYSWLVGEKQSNESLTPGCPAYSARADSGILWQPMSAFAPAPALACRKGKDFVVPRGASLPANCVKCGAPAERPWRKTFYWHPSWLYILLLLWVLIYFLVAVLVRKKMQLNIPLCDVHHDERKRLNIVGGVMLLGFIPAGILAGNVVPGDSGAGVIVGMLMFLAGIVFLIRANNYLQARFIDDTHAVIRGAKEPFLQLLPPTA